MNVNDLVRDATASLSAAVRLADTLPHEQQAAIRALIASMVVLARAVEESHRDLASRIGPAAAQISLQGPKRLPLAIGME
jgi:hypothetical protein